MELVRHKRLFFHNTASDMFQFYTALVCMYAFQVHKLWFVITQAETTISCGIITAGESMMCAVVCKIQVSCEYSKKLSVSIWKRCSKIYEWYQQFWDTEIVLKGHSLGRPSMSQHDVESMRQSFLGNPNKCIWLADSQLSITNCNFNKASSHVISLNISSLWWRPDQGNLLCKWYCCGASELQNLEQWKPTHHIEYVWDSPKVNIMSDHIIDQFFFIKDTVTSKI
jgi:uncharacterized membrane protein (DUF485 family)